MSDRSLVFVFAATQPLMLLVAFLMGLGARRIARRRALVTGSTMTVVSVVGVSTGLALAGLVVPGVRPWSPVALLIAFGVNAALLAAVSAFLISREAQRTLPPIRDVIAAGESERLEFKSSARVNTRTGQRDERMEAVVAKTVAAFLNSSGGTLLLGVDDDGRPIGLGPDFATLRQPDADRFELWLRDLLQTQIGLTAAARPIIDFTALDDGSHVCRVTCPAAHDPVYLRPRKGAPAELWVRVGNSTRAFDVAEASDYVRGRFAVPLGTSLRARLRWWLRPRLPGAGASAGPSAGTSGNASGKAPEQTPQKAPQKTSEKSPVAADPS